MDADEHTTLASWLDFYRATLAMKCDGLTDAQLRTLSAPPSPLSLLGLVQHCTGLDLGRTSPFMGGEVSLRWIYTHMIAEYARHCGHADLIRERIDGAAGV